VASRYSSGSVALGRGGGTVTLVQQTSFCLSSHDGDVHTGGAEGVFVGDTRILSRWELRVGGHAPEPLSVAQDSEDEAVFALRTPPHRGHADSPLMVLRHRRIAGAGLDETIELHNYGPERVRTVVTLDVDADLASLFDVKQGRAETVAPDAAPDTDGERLRLVRGVGPDRRGVEVRARGARITGYRVRWSVELEAGGSWSADTTIRSLRRSPHVPPDRVLTRRRTAWRHRAPALDTDLEPLRTAYEQSLRDLEALRLFGPDPDGLPVVAAGAPWFMTLFGRDSLLTGFMCLLVNHELPLGVLETLARHQGTRVDPATEEQPGRILHEVRDDGAWISYGTADAAPLFVVLLGECLRWGLPWERLEPLLPHADRALDWIERYGDRDGDGWVEYQRLSPQGSPNQGWKDSADAIVFADGSLARTPIALVEVQGYVYAAYRARAALARRAGDVGRADACDSRASDLRDSFDRDFWLPERGYYALALDGDKRPVDALTSNIGHTLWTGVARPERASAVADRLCSPEMFTGWGIRTLSSSNPAYNPMSYQRGSVWPHDTAITVAGLARYGHHEAARRIGLALLDAARDQGGRLPELVCGLSRDDVPRPVAYPTACSPQAWSSAAPLLVLRTLLGFEPDVPTGRLDVTPIPLEGVAELVLDEVPVGDRRVRLSATPATPCAETQDLRPTTATAGEYRSGSLSPGSGRQRDMCT
jgi:glycogen debranching enzyme